MIVCHSAWEPIFGDTVRASKIVDRIKERRAEIVIDGDSYRVRDKLLVS